MRARSVSVNMETDGFKRCFFRVVVFLVYILIGGAIFMQVEKEKKREILLHRQ